MIRKAQSGDNDALGKLVRQYDSLVNKFASRIRIPGYAKEDIVQEILIAVTSAIQQFDFAKEVKLITYVHKLIEYHFSNLHKTLNRDKRKIMFQPTCSLETPYGYDVSDVNQSPLEDTLQNTSHIEFDDLVTILSLGVLNGTEIQVTRMLMNRMQNVEIAEVLRTSTGRVSQIKAAIVRKLSAND